MVLALYGYAVLGALVGLVVGAVEILQRYRDAPFRAIFNLWAVGYVLLNAAISYGAFWVVFHWAGTPSPAPSGESNTLQLLGLSATAGFGGAALIRARFTSIRLPNGQEFGIGPAIVIETLLSVIDRQLDRQLATARYDTVHKLMQGIDFEKAKLRLPKELFLAMQSIPEDEAAQVARPIDEIASMDGLSSQDKSYLLGYCLLDLVGKDFLASVLNNPKLRSEYLLSNTVQVPILPA